MPRISITLRTLLLMSIFCLRFAMIPAQADEPLQEISPASMHGPIGELVEPAIDRGDLPGCVILYGSLDADLYCRAFGDRQVEPVPIPMTVDTIFDLASLTKPVATATAIGILVGQERLKLGDPVAAHLPDFASHQKSQITVEQLLLHNSGLIPDNALSDYEAGGEVAWRRICELELKAAPGAKFKYSDVGFIVLGKLVEEFSGQTLDMFCREQIFEPLEMSQTGFRPSQGIDEGELPKVDLSLIAPTEKHEGKWLVGTVHDPRARLLGGTAGHAGLFSTAGDLAKYARAVLRTRTAQSHPQQPLDHQLQDRAPEDRLPEDHFDDFGRSVAVMLQSRTVDSQLRAMGWDMRSAYSSNRGQAFGPLAVGHGGFAGTVLWIDPPNDRFFIFLSSRLHPDGAGSVNKLAGDVATLLWITNNP